MRYYLIFASVILYAMFLLPDVVAQNNTDINDTVQVYYENHQPDELDIFLLIENVCLEVFARLNPDLNMCLQSVLNTGNNG